MNETMIEEVQDLHIRIHGSDITINDILKEYNCKLNTLNLTKIREKLIMLHQEMMFGNIGMFNPNDL
tara:strand:+ start:192 stop:392 length:201 start_codon:yes stop_codon:yes gene_type:complete